MTSSGRHDVVLIHPGSRQRIYQGLASTLSAIEPPIWAGLIATFARKRGLTVRIIDANADELTPEHVADQIKASTPVLAAVVAYGQQPSASTQTMAASGAICTAIKDRDPEVKVIMVGGHVAALPERTLLEEDCDFVATGEGAYTLVDLVEALKGNSAPDLDKVRGLGYRDGSAVKFTASAPLVTDLDREMPEIAWDLLPMEKYRAHNWHCFDGLNRLPYGALYTTLGCPYHCSFCCIQAPFKAGERVLSYKENVNSYRFWAPEAVIKQIDILVTKYGVRNIKFADEMFVLNMKHVSAICDLIIERGYDLNIWAYARVDTIRSDEVVAKLRRAGFRWLAFGIEAASERVRDNVRKGFEQEDIFKALDKVRAAGINIGANYIFGLPEDDLETMQATLDLALEINAEYANFYSTMAYPGSPLYAQAIREGWPLPESWSGYSQHSEDCLPLPTKYVSAGEVLRFRDHAFQVYFTNPRYLRLIGEKFGPTTVEHIQEMTNHQLVRRNARAWASPVAG